MQTNLSISPGIGPFKRTTSLSKLRTSDHIELVRLDFYEPSLIMTTYHNILGTMAFQPFESIAPSFPDAVLKQNPMLINIRPCRGYTQCRWQALSLLSLVVFGDDR